MSDFADLIDAVERLKASQAKQAKEDQQDHDEIENALMRSALNCADKGTKTAVAQVNARRASGKRRRSNSDEEEEEEFEIDPDEDDDSGAASRSTGLSAGRKGKGKGKRSPSDEVDLTTDTAAALKLAETALEVRREEAAAKRAKADAVVGSQHADNTRAEAQLVQAKAAEKAADSSSQMIKMFLEDRDQERKALALRAERDAEAEERRRAHETAQTQLLLKVVEKLSQA